MQTWRYVTLRCVTLRYITLRFVMVHEIVFLQVGHNGIIILSRISVAEIYGKDNSIFCLKVLWLDFQSPHKY